MDSNAIKAGRDFIEHYNHNHDALGRFTFSGGVGRAISSYRQNRTARLKEDEKKLKEKLDLTKAENARNEAKLQLKSAKKLSKSRQKYYKAQAKAKTAEYAKKADEARQRRKAAKRFEKNGEVDGKTAEDRTQQREQLRKDKKYEIQEAIDTGSITKLMQYRDLMTTDEINRALNKNTANQNIIKNGKTKVDNIMNKVNWATKTGEDLYKFSQMVEKWEKRSENKRVDELFDRALKGDKRAEKEINEIKRKRDYKKTGLKPEEPKKEIKTRKKYKHDK